jgi:hypothetical protein
MTYVGIIHSRKNYEGTCRRWIRVSSRILTDPIQTEISLKRRLVLLIAHPAAIFFSPLRILYGLFHLVSLPARCQ